METFGLWHPQSLAFFKKISRRRAHRENRPVSGVYQEFLSRLSVALMRANADYHLSVPFLNRFVDPLRLEVGLRYCCFSISKFDCVGLINLRRTPPKAEGMNLLFDSVVFPFV